VATIFIIYLRTIAGGWWASCLRPCLRRCCRCWSFNRSSRTACMRL